MEKIKMLVVPARGEDQDKFLAKSQTVMSIVYLCLFDFVYCRPFQSTFCARLANSFQLLVTMFGISRNWNLRKYMIE